MFLDTQHLDYLTKDNRHNYADQLFSGNLVYHVLFWKVQDLFHCQGNIPQPVYGCQTLSHILWTRRLPSVNVRHHRSPANPVRPLSVFTLCLRISMHYCWLKVSWDTLSAKILSQNFLHARKCFASCIIKINTSSVCITDTLVSREPRHYAKMKLSRRITSKKVPSISWWMVESSSNLSINFRIFGDWTTSCEVFQSDKCCLEFFLSFDDDTT